jgi:hypothetical protein
MAKLHHSEHHQDCNARQNQQPQLQTRANDPAHHDETSKVEMGFCD